MKQKNKKSITPRYPMSAAFKEEMYRRIMRLRQQGYTVSQIIVAGVELLEKS